MGVMGKRTEQKISSTVRVCYSKEGTEASVPYSVFSDERRDVWQEK